MLITTIQWHSLLLTIIGQNVDNIIVLIVFDDTTVWKVIQISAHYIESIAWFFMHYTNRHRDSQANHIIPFLKRFSRMFLHVLCTQSLRWFSSVLFMTIYILASWQFWWYYTIFVGQVWVMFYNHDLGGRSVNSGMKTADIEESRWPKTIDDCLAYCNQNAECKGVTYAYDWGKPFLRCFFKEASRWGTPSFITSSCCHHYELTRGHEGEETEITLSVAL